MTAGHLLLSVPHAVLSAALCLTRTDLLQIYKESRTLIIEKYRETPKQRLEFPAVREAVAKSGISTDYEGLRRIYDFLDAWGLINYEASDGAGHSLGSLPPAVAASGVPLFLASWCLPHADVKHSNQPSQQKPPA